MISIVSKRHRVTTWPPTYGRGLPRCDATTHMGTQCLREAEYRVDEGVFCRQHLTRMGYDPSIARPE